MFVLGVLGKGFGRVRMVPKACMLPGAAAGRSLR